jgi:hypothetical protein
MLKSINDLEREGLFVLVTVIWGVKANDFKSKS